MKYILLFLFLFPNFLQAQETTDATNIPPIFIDPVPMSPTPLHKLVYNEMELCSLKTGNFDNILWISSIFMIRGPDQPQTLVDNQQFNVLIERRIYGLWWKNISPAGDTIQIIMLDRQNWMNPSLIAHESLHSIYNGDFPLEIQQKCLKL